MEDLLTILGIFLMARHKQWEPNRNQLERLTSIVAQELILIQYHLNHENFPFLGSTTA
jgi:hypothetical protein